MISTDIQGLAARLMRCGDMPAADTRALALQVADLAERVEELERRVVPDAVRHMPRDLQTLDGRVVSLAEVAARQRARMRVIPADGGAA